MTEWLDRVLRPGKTEEAVDHRQNNYVKAVGTASPGLRSNWCRLRCCSFNCCAEPRHKDNVRSTAVEEQLKQVQLSEP